MAGPDDTSTLWPRFVCLLLRDEQGRFVLESRPATAKAAAGRLTCFGGSREAWELPRETLLRELREELSPPVGEECIDFTAPVVVLQAVNEDVPIAWFYAGVLARGVDPVCVVPGHQLVRVTEADLMHANLAAWHRAALNAIVGGRRVAFVQSDD